MPAIQLRKVLGHGPVQPALQQIRNLYNLSRFDGKGDGEGCARHRRGKWLGHQIAIAFAQAGASVAIADLNLEGAENVAAGIRGGGQSAVAIHMDVTDEAAVTAGVDDVVSHFGAIDVLISLGFIDAFIKQTRPRYQRHRLRQALCGKNWQELLQCEYRALNSESRRRPYPGYSLFVMGGHIVCLCVEGASS